MKDINKYTGKQKLQDYIIFCDTCGAPCWHSQATLLKNDTGLGGSLVCPRDVDIRDYGLVPYKIRAEISVPNTRTNNLASPTDFTQGKAPITDFSNGTVFEGDTTPSPEELTDTYAMISADWVNITSTWSTT